MNNTVNSGQRSSVQGTLQYTVQYNTEYSPVQHLGLAVSPFLGESKCRGAGGLGGGGRSGEIQGGGRVGRQGERSIVFRGYSGT